LKEKTRDVTTKGEQSHKKKGEKKKRIFVERHHELRELQERAKRIGKRYTYEHLGMNITDIGVK